MDTDPTTADARAKHDEPFAARVAYWKRVFARGCGKTPTALMKSEMTRHRHHKQSNAALLIVLPS
jgi:hypothetical protein